MAGVAPYGWVIIHKIHLKNILRTNVPMVWHLLKKSINHFPIFCEKLVHLTLDNTVRIEWRFVVADSWTPHQVTTHKPPPSHLPQSPRFISHVVTHTSQLPLPTDLAYLKNVERAHRHFLSVSSTFQFELFINLLLTTTLEPKSIKLFKTFQKLIQWPLLFSTNQAYGNLGAHHQKTKQKALNLSWDYA